MKFDGNGHTRAAIAVSLTLFIASLGMPALEFANHEPVRGITALLWGWWGLLTFDFPWLANLFYFMVLILVFTRNRRIVQIFSAMAFVVGLLSLRVQAWWFYEGSSTPVKKLGPAFYFWMASFAALFLLLFLKRKPNSMTESHTDARKT
jgi:hypothetical protein